MNAISGKPAVIVICLLATLTFFWRQSSNPQLDRLKHLQTTLRIIELRDAELTRDILLVRAGLLANYDALTRAAQEMVSLTRQLVDQLETADPSPGTLMQEQVNALSMTVQERLLNIEYIKSDNALLRNSLMYVDGIGASQPKKFNKADGPNSSRLWRLLFSFIQNPNQNLTQAIEKELEPLASNRRLAQEDMALILHTRLIIALLPKVDKWLREMIDQSIVNRIDELQTSLNRYSSQIEGRAKRYRLMLYLFAVILAGYLLHQFAQLRAKTSYLRKTNQRLQDETLERLQAEEALRDSEARLRAITDSAHEAIVSTDSLGKIVSWNKGACIMFGYTAEQALGSLVNGLLRTQSPIERTDQSLQEAQGVRMDKTEFPIELSLSDWLSGPERYLTLIIRDISLRKHLESVATQQELQLIQANKMTALGTLVSGVAHEINNPNQLILLNSELLSTLWSDAAAILTDHYDAQGEFMLAGLPYSEMRQTLPVLIHDITEGAQRIQRIVADLKNYARPQAANQPSVFSLNEVVERAVRLLQHSIAAKTKHFKMQLDESLALLHADPQHIGQVIVNLLSNALEALENNEQAVTVSTRMLDSRQVCLEVRDEGVGIAEEHLQQLCDPFFTTKQASGGTGLGLAISASLIHAHGGRLIFSSTKGHGASACMIFPPAPYSSDSI